MNNVKITIECPNCNRAVATQKSSAVTECLGCYTMLKNPLYDESLYKNGHLRRRLPTEPDVKCGTCDGSGEVTAPNGFALCGEGAGRNVCPEPDAHEDASDRDIACGKALTDAAYVDPSGKKHEFLIKE